MKILTVNPEKLRESQEALEEAANILWRSGIVVIPTDTVYGLAVDATKEYAVKKLFKLKKRPETKPIPIIARDMEMVRKLAWFDKKVERTLDLVWPGPVTVLLNKKYNLPNLITAGRSTIGIRIPDYKLITYLIELYGRPITATSANISGQSPSTKLSDVLVQFENEIMKPELVLDAGDLKYSEPSTVLDLISKQPKIVRIGPVNKKKLLEILSI